MRLFFGLSLPDAVREKTARCADLAHSRLPGRYVPGDNHHITLAFLGETPGERLGEAAAVLAACAADFPAPRITLGDPGFFGREDNAILIIKAFSSPDLAPLHEALLFALQKRGLPASPGPFSPHVTLGRHVPLTPQALCALAARSPAQGASFLCPQAHVYLSARDEHDILRYTPVASVSFRS